VRRGLTLDPICTVCGNGCETVDHVLCNCTNAKLVWQELARQHMHCLYPRTPLNEWIEGNVKGSHTDANWAPEFLTALWYIWKWRNALCFGKPTEVPEDKGGFLRDRFQELMQVMTLEDNLVSYDPNA